MAGGGIIAASSITSRVPAISRLLSGFSLVAGSRYVVARALLDLLRLLLASMRGAVQTRKTRANQICAGVPHQLICARPRPRLSPAFSQPSPGAVIGARRTNMLTLLWATVSAGFVPSRQRRCAIHGKKRKKRRSGRDRCCSSLCVVVQSAVLREILLMMFE